MYQATQSIIQDPILDFQQVKRTANVLRALNHKYRQEILEKIAGQGSITVTDLYVALRDEQSIVSQHLRILREAAIVKAVRKGKFIYYQINEPKVSKIQEAVSTILE